MNVVGILTWFVALFPLVLAMLALDSSRRFSVDRQSISTQRVEPGADDLAEARRTWPTISVVIPARDEAAGIEETVRAALALRWPDLHVVVIDDGSVDDTAALVDAIDDPRVTLVRHRRPDGKAMSLNRALSQLTTDVVLVLDADAHPEVDVLERLAPQLMHHPDVAAITANPRVADVSTTMSALQAVEFSGTVSALRRGQAAWGRVCTMSGICTLLRRDEVLRIGGFDPRMHTEDIELTWRLHTHGWRVGYEPDALVGMGTPMTLAAWWRQRCRWSVGLVEALRHHARSLARWRNRALWPLVAEAVLSIIWSHLLIGMTAYWAVSLVAGRVVVGTPVPGRLGAFTLVVATVQILWGMHLDAERDGGIMRLWWLTPLYPLAYWWLSALTVVATTIPTLARHRERVAWKTGRGDRAGLSGTTQSTTADLRSGPG